jgi:hypothetical protein
LRLEVCPTFRETHEPFDPSWVELVGGRELGHRFSCVLLKEGLRFVEGTDLRDA